MDSTSIASILIFSIFPTYFPTVYTVDMISCWFSFLYCDNVNSCISCLQLYTTFNFPLNISSFVIYLWPLVLLYFLLSLPYSSYSAVAGIALYPSLLDVVLIAASFVCLVFVDFVCLVVLGYNFILWGLGYFDCQHSLLGFLHSSCIYMEHSLFCCTLQLLTMRWQLTLTCQL